MDIILISIFALAVVVYLIVEVVTKTIDATKKKQMLEVERRVEEICKQRKKKNINADNRCKKFKRNEENIEAFQLGIDKIPNWFIDQLCDDAINMTVITKNVNIPIDEDYSKYAKHVNRSGKDSTGRDYFVGEPNNKSVLVIASLFDGRACDGDYVVLKENGYICAYHKNDFEKKYTEIPILKEKENIKILNVDMACKTENI